MSYSYPEMRDRLFTDDGQRMFLKCRDTTQRLLDTAGAARMDKMIAGLTGDSWLMLACADRMVELDELHEISPPGSAGQHRIFVRKGGP